MLYDLVVFASLDAFILESSYFVVLDAQVIAAKKQIPQKV
jgi:hypothetical protein